MVAIPHGYYFTNHYLVRKYGQISIKPIQWLFYYITKTKNTTPLQ
jgi:hypothetical protein